MVISQKTPYKSFFSVYKFTFSSSGKRFPIRSNKGARIELAHLGEIWLSYGLRPVNRILQRDFSNRQHILPQAVQEEVSVIRSMAAINLIVYHPKTEEGQTELARRVSDVHAAAVTQRINSLSCPTNQKLALLDAVIETAKEKSREQT